MRLTNAQRGATSQLGYKQPEHSAAENGSLLWDPATAQVVVSSGGAFVPVGLRTVTRGPFVAFNLAASSTTGMALPFFATDTTVDSQPRALKMDRAGRIVGATLAINLGRSAGTAELRVSLNGAAAVPFAAGAVTLNATNPDSVSRQVAWTDGLAFAVGDTVSLTLVTDAAWAPAADLLAWLDLAFTPFA